MKMKTWVTCTLVIALLGLCGGCSLFPKLHTRPTVPTSVQKTTVRRSTKPTIVVSRPEETITTIAMEEEVETSVEYTDTPEKLTFGQRIGRAIGRLAAVTIVLAIILAILCPGVLVGFLVRTAKKWRAAATQTWRAIKEAEGTKDKDLKNALENNQSAKTKGLVEKTKAKGV